MTIIRPTTKADESILWDMLYHALYIPPGNPAFHRSILSDPQISQYVQHWGQIDDHGFLALDGNVPIGAVWIRLLTVLNSGYGYVDDHTPELIIAVIPKNRSRGVGTQLMNHMLEKTAKHFEAVCLSVSRDNPARHLYERFGFLIIAEKGDSLTMAKRFNRKI